MIKKIDYSKIIQRFNEVSLKYEKLGFNISQALELLLKENNISYLSINHRIKETDSFIGKIDRKSYKNPFDEIEDICGVRVICYYQSDVEKIKNVIRKEFDVIENENKGDNLEFDQFGYRSMHFIIKIKNEWLNTPNYRGLENLKAELQIRTILMHAWAEIEHKLAYKSKSQIPKEFRRKLSRISAKLEESDEQFEEIKNQVDTNKSNLIETAKESKFDQNVEFNLDTLQAFLDYAFPQREKSINSTSDLFDEMAENNVSLKDLVTAFEKANEYIPAIEKEMAITYEFEDYSEGDLYFMQVGAARVLLELINNNYYQKLGFKDEIIKKYREEINGS